VDFVTVVDQAIALLRQRGRLTYRTLQRQFQLDEAALAAPLTNLSHLKASKEDCLPSLSV
jgi:hypothetical protein